MHGCLERGRDLSEGLKYNNFGIHGAGSSDAADALAAVQKFIFEEHSISREELLSALDTNFSGCKSLRRQLEELGPKVGNNDPVADTLLVTLFDDLADACEAHPRTPRGGILRPGTGSAMYYIWLATGHEGMREPVVGATADGRLQGQPFSANLAPSSSVRVRWTDQHTAVLCQDQLPAHLQWRTGHDGAFRLCFPGSRIGTQNIHAGADVRSIRLPAVTT